MYASVRRASFHPDTVEEVIQRVNDSLFLVAPPELAIGEVAVHATKEG